MPTLSGAVSNICTKIEASLPATRMASSLRRDLDPMTGAALKYQIVPVGTYNERMSSNETFQQLWLRLDVHRRINESVGENENSIVEDLMVLYIATLLDPAWWRIPGTVQHIVEAPQMDVSDLVRVGNVVSFTVTVALAIVP